MSIGVMGCIYCSNLTADYEDENPIILLCNFSVLLRLYCATSLIFDFFNDIVFFVQTDYDMYFSIHLCLSCK